MKNNKLSKKLLIAIGTIILLIGILIAVLVSGSNNISNDKSDTLEFTKELENGIIISGSTHGIENIEINIITKENEKYKDYKFAINYMDELLETTINEAVLFEVSFLDKDGKEVVPDGAVTVYIDNVYIDINSGFYDYALIDGKSVEAYSANIYSIPNGDGTNYTKIYFDLNKSATLLIVNSVNEDFVDDGKDNIQMQEIKKEETVEENSILETVNKDYKPVELTDKEIDKKYNIQNDTLINGINYTNKLDGIILSHYETEMTYDENSANDEDNMKIISSISSFIYLHSKDATTTDFSSNQQVNFEDAFGFDHKSCNGPFDILYEALKVKGINIDFENATLDKPMFVTSNDRIYEINNKDEIINTVFKDLEYDEILQTVVNYDLGSYIDPDTKEEISTVNQVTIAIFYKKDNIEKARSLVYSITYCTEEILNNSASGGEDGLW